MVSFSPEPIYPHRKLNKTQGSHSSLAENSEIQEEKILPDPEMKVLQFFKKSANSMPGTGHQILHFPAQNLITIQTETKPVFFIAIADQAYQ